MTDEPTTPVTALGAGTARSALFTVLSSCVYRDPEPVPTRAFVYVLRLCGYEEKAARQAINRAAGSGWIQSSRHGREALWSVAPVGYEILDVGSVRLAALNDRYRDWDGEVVLLNVSVPETDRRLRHQLKTRLAFAGFASVSPGLWISTRRSAEPKAAAIVNELKLANSNSFIGRAGSLGDLGLLVRRAWDLDELGDQYAAFAAEFANLDPVEPDDRLLALLRLVHQRRHFVIQDPGLPGALLPAHWPGDDADRVWNAQYAQWRRNASIRWQQIRDSASGAA